VRLYSLYLIGHTPPRGVVPGFASNLPRVLIGRAFGDLFRLFGQSTRSVLKPDDLPVPVSHEEEGVLP
jgi:hypothetical protein